MVTAADVRNELAFDEVALEMSSEEFDALLEGDPDDPNDDGLIGRETERVEDTIDVNLGTETVTETLSRPTSVDEFALPMPKRPVQSVASVEIADHAGGPDVAVDDVIDHETHLELKPSADRRSWPTARRSITVEWTHGYPEGETPAPITAAIIGLVRQALQEIEADGIESESLDGHSVTYELGEDVVARHLARAKKFDAPSYYGGSQVI